MKNSRNVQRNREKRTEDMEAAGFGGEDAEDGGRWRKLIRRGDP